MIKPIGTAKPERLELPSVSISLYGSRFWVAYVANFLLVAANALIFRFADFVAFFGGTAETAGWIVGIGTGVSVPARLWFGKVIDFQGVRRVWMVTATLFIISCLSFIPLTGVGFGIYLARISFTCAIAGAFSCSIAFMCTGIPAVKRAEIIGTLGTSGFIGMALGPLLGDLLFEIFGNSRIAYQSMFASAALMGAAYLIIVIYLTNNLPAHQPRRTPPLRGMVFRYWPGSVVAVAMMMGIAIVLPSTFLIRFCSERGLGGLGLFFLVYTPTAFLVRIVGRRIPETLGRRKAAAIGLSSLAMSMLLYVPITAPWQLIFPAIAAGISHALLFPSVTTLGAEAFPERFRATGTSLILGMVDTGTLLAAPILGALIDGFGFEVMFLSAAATVGTVAISFATISALRREQRLGLSSRT